MEIRMTPVMLENAIAAVEGKLRDLEEGTRAHEEHSEVLSALMDARAALNTTTWEMLD